MKKPVIDRIYLTPVEAAELLMVSTASIRLWASKGLIAAQTTAGGHRRFLMKDIQNFAKERGIQLVSTKEQEQELKLLIVDDDEQLKRYLVEVLANLPDVAAIETAADGFEAGRKVETFKPTVILLDIMMPGMGGKEVCRRLKEEEATANIRVVAMTGYGSADNINGIIEAGAELCLTKPINTAALYQALGIDKT